MFSQSDINVLSHGISGKDTFERVSGLPMVHRQSYDIVVMATDEVGACVVGGSTFRVDITPPTQGVLGVGQDLTDKVRS